MYWQFTTQKVNRLPLHIWPANFILLFASQELCIDSAGVVGVLGVVGVQEDLPDCTANVHLVPVSHTRSASQRVSHSQYGHV